MSNNYDFKKEWDKTKKQLMKLSQETLDFLKRGEQEVIAVSKQGKLHIDSTTKSLHKEKLYYLIGKEYVGLKDKMKPSASLNKLVEELHFLEKEQKKLKQALNKKKKATRKTTKKTTKKTKTTRKKKTSKSSKSE